MIHCDRRGDSVGTNIDPGIGWGSGHEKKLRGFCLFSLRSVSRVLSPEMLREQWRCRCTMWLWGPCEPSPDGPRPVNTHSWGTR